MLKTLFSARARPIMPSTLLWHTCWNQLKNNRVHFGFYVRRLTNCCIVNVSSICNIHWNCNKTMTSWKKKTLAPQKWCNIHGENNKYIFLVSSFVYFWFVMNSFRLRFPLGRSLFSFDVSEMTMCAESNDLWCKRKLLPVENQYLLDNM